METGGKDVRRADGRKQPTSHLTRRRDLTKPDEDASLEYSTCRCVLTHETHMQRFGFWMLGERTDAACPRHDTVGASLVAPVDDIHPRAHVAVTPRLGHILLSYQEEGEGKGDRVRAHSHSV
jgi:hypothetical protein